MIALTEYCYLQLAAGVSAKMKTLDFFPNYVRDKISITHTPIYCQEKSIWIRKNGDKNKHYK